MNLILGQFFHLFYQGPYASNILGFVTPNVLNCINLDSGFTYCCFLIMWQEIFWLTGFQVWSCKIEETQGAEFLCQRKRRDLGVWREDSKGWKAETRQGCLKKGSEGREGIWYISWRDELEERTELFSAVIYWSLLFVLRCNPPIHFLYKNLPSMDFLLEIRSTDS